MGKFNELTYDELVSTDGGVLEIMIGGKVLTGIAAAGTIGLGGLALLGVAGLAWYVASKN
ncbi:class IIb bacteriocin, lactobin A/cerein 7B family [Mediterraneibacter glycyrrhizinilyticus]|nr:class IIb bacteriocin, lactobin A/cerein 7B family [Mediterraneibacter glycyrrhizinilyticus]MBM6855337.1 class IIb bacteriocin, lactobin A/cerein 7B family [Mediterraneibacter glycyrrhizinilyticus]